MGFDMHRQTFAPSPAQRRVGLGALIGVCSFLGCMPAGPQRKALKYVVQDMQATCRPHRKDRSYRARVVAIDILVLKAENARARRQTEALQRYCREKTEAADKASPTTAKRPRAKRLTTSKTLTSKPLTSKTPASAKTPPTAKIPPTVAPPTVTPAVGAPVLPAVRATGKVLVAINKAKLACSAIRRDRRFRSPPAAPAKEMLGRVDAYLRANLEKKAISIALKLTRRCEEEGRQRDEIAPLIDNVEQDRRRIATRFYSIFHSLIARGAYSAAIICGEGLIRQRSDRCNPVSGPDETEDTDPDIDESKLSADSQDFDDDDGKNPTRKTSDIGYPLAVALLPIESGALRSYVGLSFYVSHFDSGDAYGARRAHSLAAHAQVAFSDRFQLGIVVPFLSALNSSTTGGYFLNQRPPGPAPGAQRISEQENFGNIEFSLKVKLAGASTGRYAVSAYFAALAPTTSRRDCDSVGQCADDETLLERGFSTLRLGLAVNVNLFDRLTLGSGVGWVFQTIKNLNLHTDQTLDFFGAVRLHRLVAVQLGMQFSFPYVTNFEIGGIEIDANFEGRAAMMLGVQVYPLSNLQIDLGARIAINDAGRSYTDFGRAAFISSVGYLFP